MAGYANRVLTLTFPELSEEGDNVHVVIRNPRTMSSGELTPRDVAVGPNGQPIDQAEATRAGHEVLAKMVIGWHVYDATDASDDQPLLPLPATPDLVAKLPVEIQNRMAAEWKNISSPEA